MAKVRKVRKTISGKKKFVSKRKKPRKSRCPICKKVLHGVERGTSNGPKRKYGGELCSSCSRKIILLKSKVKNKIMKKEEIPISLRKYI